MVSNVLLHITRVDDTVRGRQGPFVHLWGVKEDDSLLMANYIATIRDELQSRSHPLNELDDKKIYCVKKNNEWQRAKVLEPKLSSIGTLEVFCVDSGETHSVPLSFLHTVDMPGIEADHIRHSPPLAKKFIIADAVGPGSGSQWSIPAMLFLRDRLEDQTWKAVPLSNDAEPQIVRIFDLSNQLFVTSLIQEELGLPSHTYQEALSMSKVLNELAQIEPVQSTSQDPASPTQNPSFSPENIGNSPVQCGMSPLLTSKTLLNPAEILDVNSVDASVRLEVSSVYLTPTKTESESEYIVGHLENVGSNDDNLEETIAQERQPVCLGYFSSQELKLPPECLHSSPVSVSSSNSDIDLDLIQQNMSNSSPKSANEETESSTGHPSSSPGSPQPIVEPLPLGVADNMPPVANRNPMVANLLSTLVRSPPQTELLPTPSNLKKVLMPHQRWGLSWMLWRESEIPSGGYFSHLGFEKHLCIVALLLHDKEKLTAQVRSNVISPWPPGQKHSRATLILCPNHAMNNWSDQIRILSKDKSLTVARYYGMGLYAVPKSERNVSLVPLGQLHQFDVVIAAYETVSEEISALKIDDETKPILDFDPNVDGGVIQQSILFQIGFNRIILDDAEIIRDSSKIVSQAVCRMRAVHRWAVSATPIRDREWFPVFRFLRIQPFCDLEILNSWLNEGERPKERLKLLISTLNLTRVPVLPDNRVELYSPGFHNYN